MKKLLIISTIIFLCGLLSYNIDENNDQDDQPVFTDLTGPYLGQTPPGNTPIRFSTAEFLSNSSWGWHGAPEFSPDGKEMYFTVMELVNPTMKIYYSKQVEGRWTKPVVTPFSQSGRCSNPRFSNDGSTIYFIKRGDADFLYKTIRNGDGWSNPIAIHIPLPQGCTNGWQFSITDDETIYFELWTSDSQKIYYSKKENEIYSQPEPVFPDNATYDEYAPYIAPNGDYIIFVSNYTGGYGQHDLLISFKEIAGSWSDWINLGSTINTIGEDWMPNISYDGQYFFFVTSKPGDYGDNPYWVSTSFIGNF